MKPPLVTRKMDIFDGLHPQCVDSIDLDDSDTSEDSDMKVIERLVEPPDEDDLRMFIVDIGESEEPAQEPFNKWWQQGLRHCLSHILSTTCQLQSASFHHFLFPQVKKRSWLLCCSLALAKIACERPRWFLSLARSMETPKGFLSLGWFLIWARYLKLGAGGVLIKELAVDDCSKDMLPICTHVEHLSTRQTYKGCSML